MTTGPYGLVRHPMYTGAVLGARRVASRARVLVRGAPRSTLLRHLRHAHHGRRALPLRGAAGVRRVHGHHAKAALSGGVVTTRGPRGPRSGFAVCQAHSGRRTFRARCQSLRFAWRSPERGCPTRPRGACPSLRSAHSWARCAPRRSRMAHISARSAQPRTVASHSGAIHAPPSPVWRTIVQRLCATRTLVTSASRASCASRDGLCARHVKDACPHRRRVRPIALAGQCRRRSLRHPRPGAPAARGTLRHPSR